MSTTTYPATAKQIEFIISLGKQVREAVNALPEGDKRTGYTVLLNVIGTKVRDGEVSKSDASSFIDALKEVNADLPRAPRTGGDKAEPEAGMYRQPDGTIVRVYLGQKSGRMLLKQLVSDGDHHEYEYVGAAAYKLDPEATALPLEEAKEFGRMTGHCCVCARRLDDPESVEAGIGPVCAGKFDA